MQRLVVVLSAFVAATLLPQAVAQISPGDRLLVVKQDAEVCRMQVPIGKLDKGTIITAKAVQVVDDGTSWIKIDHGPDSFGWIHEGNLARDGLAAVKLDEIRKVTVFKEDPPIRMARGTTKLVEDTVRIRHSITISSRWKIESGAKVEVKAGVIFPYGPAIVGVFCKCEAEIRAEIEKTTGQHFGIETERKRSIIIDGDKIKSGVKVVWLEYYRTGMTTMLVNGAEHQVPFEFREDFGLTTKEVDEVPLYWFSENRSLAFEALARF